MSTKQQLDSCDEWPWTVGLHVMMKGLLPQQLLVLIGRSPLLVLTIDIDDEDLFLRNDSGLGKI